MSRGSVSDITISPADKVIAHETLVTVHKPIAHVYRVLPNIPQELVLKAGAGVTGVEGTRMMRGTVFAETGARRLLTFTDQTTIVEEVVEAELGKYFFYKIWNSSIPAQKFLEYATNQFWFVDQGAATMVRWRRAFKLRSGYFPGILGPAGRLYFKWTYVSGTFAPYMDQTVLALKRYIEAAPAR
ncbi:MAG TPA: hypothetical protein VGO93_18470 [Candidatus Xenobia bacterium]|jgi:hypothetical protein